MRLSPTPTRWAKRLRFRSKAIKGFRRLSPEEQAQLWLAKPPPGRSHDKKRRDIINPNLCNEAIDLIQSTNSLPPPGTCDVIDLNPGTSVWSDALHRALKPRRHVLVEYEKDHYAHAIDPLLHREGSRYRHTKRLLDAFDLNQDLLSDDFRAYHRNLLPDERSQARYSRNRQLIITANFSGRAVGYGGYDGPLSKCFMDAFYYSIASNIGAVQFNDYGLVKLLAWVPEEDKYSIVPRCASFRYRTSKLLEASCHIREIVSSFPNREQTTGHSAWHGAALENCREVAEKQRNAGIEVPEHRRQPEPEPPSIFYLPVADNFKKLLSLRNQPPLVAQYINFLEKVTTLENEELHWDEEKKDRLKLRLLKNRMFTTHNQYTKTEVIARGFVALERELISLRRQHPEDKTPYLDRLKKYQETAAFAELKTRASLMFKDNRYHVDKARDDYRVLSHDPHILAWNNRDFEPLLCQPKKDFLPHHPMTLLEITPKEEFVKRINTSLRWICFDYIVREFDLGKKITVQKVLERLIGQPPDSDVYREFLAQVPSLTDPLYGGHHDLSDFNARTLPMDTLIDVALAYEKFPFRKDETQMVGTVLGRHTL